MHNISSASFSLRNSRVKVTAYLRLISLFVVNSFRLSSGNIKSVLQLPIDYLDRVHFGIKEFGVGSSTLNNDVNIVS